jgi:hypothetical protein
MVNLLCTPGGKTENGSPLAQRVHGPRRNDFFSSQVSQSINEYSFRAMQLHSTQDMTVGKAFALNANAVNLLSSNGNHVQGAIDELIKAIEVLRQCLVPVITAANNVSCHDSSNDTVLGDGQHYTFRSVPTSIYAFLDHHDDNSFYLFKRAILVEECDHTLTPSDRLMNYISMVVAYNLGLAHHLLGMQNGDNQRKNYSKALTMYHAAYDLMMECPADNRDLLYLAVLNNMGHIYNYSFDSRNSQACLEGMEFIVMPYSSNGKKMSDDYTPFLMNIFMFSKQKKVVTASAA